MGALHCYSPKAQGVSLAVRKVCSTMRISQFRPDVCCVTSITFDVYNILIISKQLLSTKQPILRCTISSLK